MSDDIQIILEPNPKDLGEFSVSRLLPDARRQRVGPFIFFDYIGPAQLPPGTGVNVRSHPHIGLATITYLFAGEILHRDSLGYVQPIRRGEVNWMTAGRGIVHSEKVSDEVLAAGQYLHGIQTWVALPVEAEEIEPRFEHYAATDIPQATPGGAECRVIIGTAFGVTSPVETESETLYVDVNLPDSTSLALPEAEELGVFVVAGEARLNGRAISPGHAAVIDRPTGAVSAAGDTHLILFGGAALEGHRTVWWNFVSSSKERIEQAKRDWREGRFDPVPEEPDFIPLPE